MALNEAMDPMGLGGVGGGWFGGDPEGSGGSLLTGNPNTTGKKDAEVAQNIKDIASKWGVKNEDFWGIAQKGIIQGRIGLEALGLAFDDKYGLISSTSLMSFLNEQENETEDEAEARVEAALKGLFANILDNTPTLTPIEKSALADVLANEVTDSWEGTITSKLGVNFDIMDVLNPKVKDAILSWKTENNIPQNVTIESIYDKDKKAKDFPRTWTEERKGLIFGTNTIDLWDEKMDKARKEVDEVEDNEDLDLDAKVDKYLGKKTDIGTIMKTVDAGQNKGRFSGNIHNVGYKGPVKGITTPLGPGQTFTQVQANIPTSNWSAAQHAKAGPFAGMIGLQGQGLNPSSLAPVADVSFNPSTSWGNFNTNAGLHGTAGYNTQTGAYGNVGATATGNLFGGTFGANIGYNTNVGPTAGVNYNYSW